METNEKNESILYSLENLLLTENDESNELLHLLEDFDLFLKDENDLFDYDVDSLVRCQLNHNFLEKTQGVLQNFENLYKKSQLIHDEIEKDYQSVLQMEDCVVVIVNNSPINMKLFDYYLRTFYHIW
ncbi:hypothetical protein A3Q56_04628 [Intoshia linei]|uniref:Uncharacterized protein n=1 Tax=Intoshia linei TaxID=1819745 RepID=A0A177B056_9BILA|nr:hypothetical protein A3Q56_04628 [Intoshia linei]